MHDSEAVSAAIKQLSDRLRAAKAASPSPLRRMQRANVFDEVLTPTQTPARTRKRKPTLAGVARQAARAGIEAARYEVRPDGTVAVVTGKPSVTTDTDINDTTTPDRSEWN